MGTSGDDAPMIIPDAIPCTSSLPFGDASEISSRSMVADVATSRWLIGPAMLVRISERTTFLKLREFTGVGFAQPMTGNPVAMQMAGIMTVPQGSMCLIGFSVTRPSMRAVGWQERPATHGGAASRTRTGQRKDT